MKTRAAVAVQAGKPLEIMEVDLDGPRTGKVLVNQRLAYVTQMSLPCQVLIPRVCFLQFLDIGAGIVREVGAGVTSVQPGDHVIPLYTPNAECDYCLHPRADLCQAIRTTQGQVYT